MVWVGDCFMAGWLWFSLLFGLLGLLIGGGFPFKFCLLVVRLRYWFWVVVFACVSIVVFSVWLR